MNRSTPQLGIVSLCLFILVANASISYGAAKAPGPARYQAVWVDAFHAGFKNPQETRQLIQWARSHNVNALFVEVRKCGDAYYRSRYEPMAGEVAPGYDPLADLIQQAHNPPAGKQRIEIHAWMIVYRIATSMNVASTHVIKRHPEWLSVTASGGRNDAEGLFLDPGVPSVIDHTDLVVTDLVTRYNLDGIHFDRIRYHGSQWGYNPIALMRFQKRAGLAVRPSPEDSDWNEFRREQIDMMIQRLYVRAKSLRPTIKVSAATIAFDKPNADFRLTKAYGDVMQNWRKWAREGWLDLNCLMNYKRETVADQADDFRGWMSVLASNRGYSLPIVGQGGFINEPTGSSRQVDTVFRTPGMGGVLLYSYAQLARNTSQNNVLAENLRLQFKPNVPTPSLPSAASQGYGWVGGRVGTGTADHVRVALMTTPPRQTYTDGSGFFSFTRVPAGEYKLGVEATNSAAAWTTVKVTAGKVSGLTLNAPPPAPAFQTAASRRSVATK